MAELPVSSTVHAKEFSIYRDASCLGTKGELSPGCGLTMQLHEKYCLSEPHGPSHQGKGLSWKSAEPGSFYHAISNLIRQIRKQDSTCQGQKSQLIVTGVRFPALQHPVETEGQEVRSKHTDLLWHQSETWKLVDTPMYLPHKFWLLMVQRRGHYNLEIVQPCDHNTQICTSCDSQGTVSVSCLPTSGTDTAILVLTYR